MTLKQIQEALGVRRGGTAKIWEYQVSHQWLIIRLTAPHLVGNFHLSCGACERAEFDTCWSPVTVQVEQVTGGFVVSDGAHLHIKCGVLEGTFNAEPFWA